MSQLHNFDDPFNTRINIFSSCAAFCTICSRNIIIEGINEAISNLLPDKLGVGLLLLVKCKSCESGIEAEVIERTPKSLDLLANLLQRTNPHFGTLYVLAGAHEVLNSEFGKKVKPFNAKVHNVNTIPAIPITFFAATYRLCILYQTITVAGYVSPCKYFI